MAESDSKAKARAAYQRLDADLRDERRDWIRAAVVAVAAFAGFMLLLGLLTTTGPSKRPIGARVLINQRRTWFGGHRHGLIGLAPAER
ncbi:MAG: hypothetical protein K0R38_4392 [Polyangiaceae bacterium]|nr:hypothetical protein [Polyangiaceae bacterium]